MKRTVVVLSVILIYSLLCSVSCEEPEPFIKVKAIESQVYNEIKAYREANGKTGPFVLNYPMVMEAQFFSTKLVYADNGIDTTGIAAHWDVIHSKFGGTNDHTLLQITSDVTASEIASNWTGDAATAQVLLGEFTQCGIGIEYDADNVAYVTMLLMLVESK